MHGLVAKKAKPGRPSTFAKGLQHQDHVKMNAHILGNAQAVQRQNDQKVVNRTHVKTKQEWVKLVTFTKQCPPFPKPTLVKLTFKGVLLTFV